MNYDEVKFAANAVMAYKRNAILKTHNEVMIYVMGLIWGNPGAVRNGTIDVISADLHKWVSQLNPFCYM